MAEPIKLFQYNTLSALMSGLFEGSMTIGELLEQGDLGIGTLDAIDGELIVLDGKAYQARGDKTITDLDQMFKSLTQQSYFIKQKLSLDNVLKRQMKNSKHVLKHTMMVLTYFVL